jgi:hypothetical protein
MPGHLPDKDQRTVEEIMNEADPAHAPTSSLLVNYRWTLITLAIITVIMWFLH